MDFPDQDLLNELLERINNAEKRNENLRKDIQTKKNELKLLDDKLSEEEKNKIENEKKKVEKKPKIPTNDEDNKLSERFLYEYRNIKDNSYVIEQSATEYTIEYITQEQHSTLYIMGDFTKWELMPMKKNKDIYSYTIVLLKGFKYYYSFQSGDQLIIDYNNLYEQNPKNSQIQNYIDLTKDGQPSQPFDFENDINILKNAQKNYFLIKLNEDENEISFLDKFKRHIIAGKEITQKKREEHGILTNSIYTYYDSLFKKIKPYETDFKYNNLKNYFKDRILVHYSESKEFKCKYFYKIINISDFYEFRCMKLYDNNNIKIDNNYYSDSSNYYSFRFEVISVAPIDENSKLYHLLPKEESTKILNDYNNDKENVLKAYFKTLNNLKNAATDNQILPPVPPVPPVPPEQNPLVNNENIMGFRSYIRSYGNILVNPYKVEPERIKITDYEFHYSFNRINKVKNKKEGSFVQFEAIDDATLKARKPFRFKFYYSIKDKKINIIHCHVIDKNLRTNKIILKEIGKDIDPHTLKKNEDYIKNNELLLLVKEQIPIKLYFQGKKVKTEFIKIEENKLYNLTSSNTDSIFNNMYVTVNKIGDKINYDLIEKCNEFPYSLGGIGDIQDGVDVQVTFDNNKHYVVEPMMLAVSPCLLGNVSTYEENLMNKNKIQNINNNKNMNQMDIYISITKNMNDYRKFNKETFDKLEQKQKDDILLKLKQDKESMVSVLNNIQQMEMWDALDEALNISTEIENLIKLFSNK
jgi:hypothetical protein